MPVTSSPISITAAEIAATAEVVAKALHIRRERMIGR
jgi:hypothetical protein